MSDPTDSALALLERIERKAPEYYDLLTATTDEEFETAFDAILGRAVSQMERQRKNLAELDEVGLSGTLAMALSIPGLTVTPEPHSNGHVDLMIVADHCVPERIKLGEAKIYRGPEYHVKGMEQLLGRYTTGREGRGLLIEYYRSANISDLVAKLRAKLDVDLPCKQRGQTVDHVLKWSFRSTHTLTSGDDHQIGHIGCNLHAD